jgi:putative MATE family efflux protein
VIRRARPVRLDERDREILRLAVPAFFALVAEPLYVLTDTAIVGHLGTVQLAGLSAASAVLLTGYSVFVFLAYGTTATVARMLGAGRPERAAEQAVQSLWLAIGAGVVVALAGALASRSLIGLFTHDPAVREQALVYLRVSLLGVPAILVTLAGVGYLRGLLDTRRPLYVALVTALVNLVIEVILIYGLDQGIGASAAATVVAQWLGAGAYLWWIGRDVAARGVRLRPDLAIIRSVGRVGGHLIMRTIAVRGSFLVAAAAAARIGTIELAAHEVAFQMMYLLAFVLDAIAIAGQALVGRLLGAGDADAARAAARRMITWSVGVGVIAAVVLLAGRTALPRIFSDDIAVRELAAFLLVHTAVMQPINGAVFALDGILIGAGDQRYRAGAMLVAAGLFVPIVVIARISDAGIGWLWFAIEVLMVARLVPLVARFRTNRWAVVGATQA